MENGELFAERVISDEDEIDRECIAHPLLEDVASDGEEESFSSSSSSEEYISRNGFFITAENDSIKKSDGETETGTSNINDHIDYQQL